MKPRSAAAFSPCRPNPYPDFSLLIELDLKDPKSAAGAAGEGANAGEALMKTGFDTSLVVGRTLRFSFR